MSVTYVHFRPAALHIPRRPRVDWLAAAVWLGLIPISAVIGWYGVARLILWLIHL